MGRKRTHVGRVVCARRSRPGSARPKEREGARGSEWGVPDARKSAAWAISSAMPNLRGTSAKREGEDGDGREDVSAFLHTPPLLCPSGGRKTLLLRRRAHKQGEREDPTHLRSGLSCPTLPSVPRSRARSNVYVVMPVSIRPGQMAFCVARERGAGVQRD